LASRIDLQPFRLAGGTALAWHLGRRLSEDLDFFSFAAGVLDDPHARALAEALQPYASSSIRSGERTMHVSVAGCRVSFFEVEGQWFDPPVRVNEGIALASVREVAAMKLVAVMTRCAKKDFYDLVAIEDHGMPLSQMVESAQRMYVGFDAALPHLRRSLRYFAEAETDPDPMSTVGMRWPEVKRRVELLSRTLP
jgi:predicted nucleotidyltransferase component of viral defense system